MTFAHCVYLEKKSILRKVPFRTLKKNCICKCVYNTLKRTDNGIHQTLDGNLWVGK